MKLKNLLFSVTVIMIVLIAGPSWAHNHGERLQAQKIALEKTDVSLPQIIDSIESNQHVQVIRVEVEPYSLSQGPMCYELYASQGTSSWIDSIFTYNKAKKFYVDVTSGKVFGQGKPFWRYFYFTAACKANAVDQVKLSMSQAIPLAEKETGGKTVLVRVHRDSGIVFYQITMIVNDSLKRVLVDSYNGKVTDVPVDRHGHFKG
jgi:uncharacterized membrane protein YkoI